MTASALLFQDRVLEHRQGSRFSGRLSAQGAAQVPKFAAKTNVERI